MSAKILTVDPDIITEPDIVVSVDILTSLPLSIMLESTRLWFPSALGRVPGVK